MYRNATSRRGAYQAAAYEEGYTIARRRQHLRDEGKTDKLK